jgi:hypothetical protein
MLHRNALAAPRGSEARRAPHSETQRDPAMLKSFDDVQKLNQANMDSAMKIFGEYAKGWQTIAAEASDYAKRSFEDGTQTFEKLVSAKSPEQVFEIQSSYMKRATEDYFREMSKFGALYSDLAKEAVKPFEVAMKKVR